MEMACGVKNPSKTLTEKGLRKWINELYSPWTWAVIRAMKTKRIGFLPQCGWTVKQKSAANESE